MCFLTLEGDFLMKTFVFLMLTFSTFLAVACDGGEDMINSVGGPATDGNNLAQTNSGLSASSGLVGTDCITLPTNDCNWFFIF